MRSLGESALEVFRNAVVRVAQSSAEAKTVLSKVRIISAPGKIGFSAGQHSFWKSVLDSEDHFDVNHLCMLGKNRP